jgi:NAD(P)-dependent dehydrogenase (short-subunit alcohol dehydrogenase family)
MSSLDFTGRCIVITGAGRGIGRGYALELGRRGASVIINDISAGPAHAVAEEINSAGGVARAIVADLTDPDAGAAIVGQSLEHFGALDAVIVNASINGKRKAFPELSVDDLERMLAVNVFGAWRLLQAAWPHLAATGRGRILLTTSQAGLYGMPRLAEYATAKAALIGLMRTLAHEGDCVGIKVNAIAPAATTRLTEETVTDPAALDMLRVMQPPHLVAPVAALLVHEACPVTGETYLAGGAHVSRAFTGETQGLTLPADGFTTEAVQRQWDVVRAEADYRVPRDISETGDLQQKAEVMRLLKASGIVN